MSVPITGTIVAYAGGAYPVIDPIYGIDGWRSVADHTARNAIGTMLRREGMAVWTQNDSLLWTLNPSPWAGDDTDWTEFSGSGGSGTVTTVSVVSTNGLAGSVANATTTPAITLTTTITGILKGNATAISAATAGTDYVIPSVVTLSSLASIGTITVGTWNASPIAANYGGTGLATLTAHAVMLGEGTSTVAFATIGTAGRILTDQGGGADPAFVAPVTQRPFTAILGIGANIVTGTNSANVYSICAFSGTFTRWDVAIPAANQPSGASLVIDVLKSSNQGSTWTSLWASTPSNRPTVTTGTNSGGGTAFDMTTFSAGDWLRYDVITAGGGAVQNVALTLSSQMNQ